MNLKDIGTEDIEVLTKKVCKDLCKNYNNWALISVSSFLEFKNFKN